MRRQINTVYGTLEVPQAQLIQNVIDRFTATKTTPIPASPPLEHRHASEDKAAVDVPFREGLGSLIWIATETRPKITIAVGVLATFSHDPKTSHWNAACNALDNRKATTHLELKERNYDGVDLYRF